MSTLPRCGHAASLALLAILVSCADDTSVEGPKTTTPTTTLLPGEICDKDNRPELHLSFDPPNVVVAPGQLRPVRLTVEPDMCDPATATFTATNASIAAAPADATFDLRKPTYDFVVTGGSVGRSSIKAKMAAKDPNGKEYTTEVELPIDVREAKAPSCTGGGTASGTLAASSASVHGQGALAKAYVSAPAAAFTRTDEFALPSLPVDVACATKGDRPTDLTAELPEARLRALGPAVSFTAQSPLGMSKAMRREVEVAIPVNPALFPPGARMRHLLVLYTGPRVKTARPIPVANPRIEADGDDYLLKFSTPWLGTFQAAVEESAGSRVRRRRLTHRAVIGFSMGGGGAAVFGMRHHDKFDVIGPLGGPSDWTWLLWYIENFALGGFCPAGKTCPKVAPNRYTMDEPYAHTIDYDHWFYEKGSGNGGSFPRNEYIQIFEDLALAMGNPNGSGDDRSLMHVARGPKRGDPWLTLPDGTDCSFTVDPIGKDPNEQKQKEIEARCTAWRCDPAHAWRAETGYYDDEYNPDGSLPVGTFCDGAQNGVSPYTNTWAPGGNKPVNLGLYVDLNKNGTRDMGEPVIRAGHEPYDDCGSDGLCNEYEQGADGSRYDPVTNPDPAQDDYDYTLNPNGTEGNHRWDPGERYADVGLDGVAGTAGKHVAGDVGEGDGQFTMSAGLTNFYANDPHAIIARRAKNVPGGELTDDALRRIDVLSDGGVRDLFNFASVASHLSGQIGARTKPGGVPLRSIAFYNGFHFLPGEPQDKPNFFVPTDIRWADVADMPSVRYGDLDATPSQIEQGDGQHVGTAPQLLYRLQTAFFYVGKAWPDADRTLTEESRDKPDPSAIECEVAGRCEHIFTGPRTRREGPIAVSLPPGYALEANVKRNVRYPVLYVLHGYGQDPRDLEGVAIFTNNFMNVAQRSAATRLAKFIIVYVDGRCRVHDGKPECIRGTFYMDSARDDGAKMDAWFDEVVDFVDQTYRTMGPADVDVVE
jgi:hypothetical protein